MIVLYTRHTADAGQVAESFAEPVVIQLVQLQLQERGGGGGRGLQI